MELRVYTVRVGDKYGPEYEERIRERIPHIEVLHEGPWNLQWNKISFFNVQGPDPVVVLDIDIDLVNDYMDLINYPIERGEFLSMRSWWEDVSGCELNGGFYKFYPDDVRYIYNEFAQAGPFWEQYFIDLGVKPGPVNGEENFVEYMVKKRLDLKFIPDEWCGRMVKEPTKRWLTRINRKYPGDYFYLDKVNPDVKILHYTMGS